MANHQGGIEDSRSSYMFQSKRLFNVLAQRDFVLKDKKRSPTSNESTKQERY